MLFLTCPLVLLGFFSSSNLHFLLLLNNFPESFIFFWFFHFCNSKLINQRSRFKSKKVPCGLSSSPSESELLSSGGLLKYTSEISRPADTVVINELLPSSWLILTLAMASLRIFSHSALYSLKSIIKTISHSDILNLRFIFHFSLLY